MDREEVTEKILGMIEDICGDDIVWEERDMDLFEEGLFDSLAGIEMLVDIETEFGVTIAPTEVEREEMNTPNLIIDRVMERL